MNRKKTKNRFCALSIVLTMMCACSFGFISCGDDEKSGGGTAYDPSKPVVLTSFYPDSGGIASKVILDGENFGSDPSKIKVYFNSKPAAVVGSSGSRMYAIVPRMPGDTCTVSVVVGNDSVVYDQTFRYKIATVVRTIVGNGTAAFKGGTLAEATVDARYLTVDKDNNIFLSLGPGANNEYGLARINEEENIVTLLVAGNSVTTVPCADPVTGVVSVPDNGAAGVFYTLDPAEGWAMRMRYFKWKEGTILPSSFYKKATVYHKTNGYIYVHHYSGQLVKVHSKTYEAETIYEFGGGDAYGMAFHPLHPNLLYLAFDSNAGANAHCIYSFDVETLELTKIAGISGGGHRDGPLDVALFRNPYQIQFDSEGNLYIADRGNHCIRRITTDNRVETVLGIPGVSGKQDGGKETATFNDPRGICVTVDGSIYVADFGNKLLRKLTIE